jgi:hypothetical protein
MNMLKSFRAPVTTPAVVTNYYEPSTHNGLSLVGGNRGAHQLFVAHQIRLINTIIGSIRGLQNKRALEIASQNKQLCEHDLHHLHNIIDRLTIAELINNETQDKLIAELAHIFAVLFPSKFSNHLTARDKTDE